MKTNGGCAHIQPDRAKVRDCRARIADLLSNQVLIGKPHLKDLRWLHIHRVGLIAVNCCPE